MQTLQINIPDAVDVSPEELTVALAAQLYSMGKLSLGHAADLCNYSKTDFISLLARFNVSVFNYPADELDQDLANAKSYHC
jgi:predicted HTH domain antitoxin